MIDNRTANLNLELPDPSNKISDDVLRIINSLWLVDAHAGAVLLMLAQKAAVGHHHTIAEITNLAFELGNLSPKGHSHALDDLTDVDAPTPANGHVLIRRGTRYQTGKLLLADIDGWEATVTSIVTGIVAAAIDGAPGALDTLNELAAAMSDDPNFAATMINALAGKAPLAHNQAISTITGLQGELDLKASASALATGLAGKSNNGHGHAQSEITGLVAALSGKQATLGYTPARSLGGSINGFSWNGANGSIQFFVDGTYVGEGATQGWVSGVLGSYYHGGNIGAAVAGVVSAVGSIGSVAMLRLAVGSAVPGDYVAGGSLQYSGTDLLSGGTPAGTWRCLGRANSGHATAYVRVS